MAETGISDYLANGWLATLRNVPFVVPITCLKLHIGVPGVGGTTNPSVVTDLQAASFASPSAGVLNTTGSPPAWNMTAAESIKYVSAWDSYDTGTGNWLFNAALSSPQVVANGDVFRLGGNIKLTITGLVTP